MDWSQGISKHHHEESKGILLRGCYLLFRDPSNLNLREWRVILFQGIQGLLRRNRDWTNILFRGLLTYKGAAEVTNRTILQGLKKMLDDFKNRWMEELPNVLWSYKTTPRTATGETPFNLCFRIDAMIPTEMKATPWGTRPLMKL